ncbi:Inositol-1-monophosphatase [Paraconexibacter sp. AEG42_29]|uniref:Inositol-1-monophosphatase n=1 Tax=Paraconexibacter sp. AEG42_29 TaxID=2997339 RepID=A0AAU7ATL9_9ACTN
MSRPLVIGPPPADAEALLGTAERAARAAGAMLLERFAGGADAIGQVYSKSTSTDLVSEADMAAERAIRAILAEERPDDAVMGEEGDDTPGTSGRRWIVDPLDGTINYLYGLSAWCVSVACEGLAGVVFDPLSGELFASPVTAGAPATCNGAPIAGRGVSELGQSLLGTGFGYDREIRAAQAPIVAGLLPEVRDVRRIGSAALDLAWCASGRLDAYYEFGVKPWDIAAGVLLCAASGLEVHELAGGPVLPSGILVAPPAIAGELVARVEPPDSAAPDVRSEPTSP